MNDGEWKPDKTTEAFNAQLRRAYGRTPTEPPKAEAPQLLPIFDKDRLAFKMWYI